MIAQNADAILDSLATRMTEPATSGNVLDAITSLMDTDITRVTEYHLIHFLTIRLESGSKTL